MLGTFSVFCFLGLFSSTIAFSHDYSIESLLKNEDHSIIEETESKIYLNFDRLNFDQYGMFLESDFGELFPLENLSYERGLYCLSKPTRWVCSSCGKEFTSARSICLERKSDGSTCFGSVSPRYDLRR